MVPFPSREKEPAPQRETLPDKAAQKAIRRLSSSEATERLLRVAASALEEGGEELLGGVTAPPLQSLYNGRSVAQNYRDMKPGDVLYDALIGGILGAAGGSADVTRDAVRTNLPRNMTREIPLRTAPRDGRMETREIKTEVVRNGDQQGEVGRDQPGYATALQEKTGRSGVPQEVRRGQETNRQLLRVRYKYEEISKRAAKYGTSALFEDAKTWTHKHFAFTDKQGAIHISKAIPEEYIVEAVEHELNHVMKRKDYRPYMEFVSRVNTSVNLVSEAGNRLIERVAEHRGIDATKPLSDKEIDTISDEIAAIVRGAEMSGHAQEVMGDLQEAFDDYDAFASELAKIHEQYVKDVAEEKRREESKS